MIKKKLVIGLMTPKIILLFEMYGMIYAQDYQPVKPGRIAYFERNGEIR
jgi:hypothetical protein